MAEIKLTKSDIVKLFHEQMIIERRVKAQQIEAQISELSKLSDDEINQILSLAKPRNNGREGIERTFVGYWYGGNNGSDDMRFNDVELTFEIKHEMLPEPIRMKRVQIRALQVQLWKLNRELDHIRSTSASIMEMMERSEAGKQILELIRKFKIDVKLPDNNNQ